MACAARGGEWYEMSGLEGGLRFGIVLVSEGIDVR